MGKFRIRVKLQGFELEVDGDRDDIPALTAAVQQQFAGLVSPPALDEEVEKPSLGSGQMIEGNADRNKKANKKRDRVPRNPEGAASPIDFRHDSAKFGSPKQTWTVAQKCIWLLFAVEGTTGQTELSASQITSTWNAQFKVAGKLHPPNVPRDLNQAKIASPAPVGEHKGNWFLTEEGKRQATELLKQ